MSTSTGNCLLTTWQASVTESSCLKASPRRRQSHEYSLTMLRFRIHFYTNCDIGSYFTTSNFHRTPSNIRRSPSTTQPYHLIPSDPTHQPSSRQSQTKQLSRHLRRNSYRSNLTIFIKININLRVELDRQRDRLTNADRLSLVSIYPTHTSYIGGMG